MTTTTHRSVAHQYLREREVVELLRVTRVTLKKWRDEEGLPFLRIGSHRIRYERDSLMQWLATRTVNA